MLGLLKKLFGSKPAAETAEVPYKVEKPATEVVVTDPPTVVASLGEPPATVVVVEGAGEVAVAKEKPARKKSPAKKPAGEKKPAGKRGGRKPKAKTEN